MSPLERIEHAFADDAAVSTFEQDEFQRYPFAKRIAETIRTRQATTSLVLGLYGKWGSGKSSILNFIIKELAGTPVITMVFNPWLFADDGQLLLGFFSQLSDTLTALDATASGEARRALAAYQRKLAFRVEEMAIAATAAQVSAFTATASLEGFKHRLSELLQSTGKRILILIDDLDRLDKQEIQAMLRLVKLTGDFHYTTYLLAFDDEMVSQAIGERYAGGDSGAGRRFLEKIIQVPLHVPIIQKQAMEKFFQASFKRSLELTNTWIADSEKERLISALSAGIMPRVTTPRHVIRFSNALLVILPLLKGEANMVDLLLLEALKVFYLDLYELASKSQHLLTGVPQSMSVNDISVRYDSIFGKGGEKLGDARLVFYTLFPKLIGVYGKPAVFGVKEYVTEEELYAQQHIASSYYFRRYFSYAVQDGEIPDSSIDSFTETMASNDIDKAYQQAKVMIERSNENEFIRRLNETLNKVTLEEAETYCELFLLLEKDFSQEILSERLMQSLSGIYALILSYLNLLPKHSIAAVCTRLLAESSNFTFAYELLRDIDSIGHWSDDNPYDHFKDAIMPEDYESFTQIVVDRAMPLLQNKLWYDVFKYDARFFLKIWNRAYGNEPVLDSLRDVFDENPQQIATLLQRMSPLGSIGNKPAFFSVDVETYNILKERLDVSYLFEVALNAIGNAELMPYKAGLHHNVDEVERIHQFINLHRLDIVIEKASAEES